MWERSNLVQDAWYVALDKGEYVGMTEILSNQADPGLFDMGVTGVLRSHRRRGIATALKLRGMEFAQERGIRELRTWNASDNGAILAVNRQLGFVRRPAHIAYVKEVRAERPEDGGLTLGGELVGLLRGNPRYLSIQFKKVGKFWSARFADRILRHHDPAGLVGAVFEEGLDGGADCGFVGDVEVGELGEGRV